MSNWFLSRKIWQFLVTSITIWWRIQIPIQMTSRTHYWIIYHYLVSHRLATVTPDIAQFSVFTDWLLMDFQHKKFIQTRKVECASDHDVIITTLKVKGSVNVSETYFCRNLRNLNEEDFKLDLWGQRWMEVYQLNNVNYIVSKIFELFLEILNKHIPRKFKTKRLKKNH